MSDLSKGLTALLTLAGISVTGLLALLVLAPKDEWDAATGLPCPETKKDICPRDVLQAIYVRHGGDPDRMMEDITLLIRGLPSDDAAVPYMGVIMKDPEMAKIRTALEHAFADQARGVPSTKFGKAHRLYMATCLRGQGGGQEAMRSCAQLWKKEVKSAERDIGINRSFDRPSFRRYAYQSETRQQGIQEADRRVADEIVSKLRRAETSIQRREAPLQRGPGARAPERFKSLPAPPSRLRPAATAPPIPIEPGLVRRRR